MQNFSSPIVGRRLQCPATSPDGARKPADRPRYTSKSVPENIALGACASMPSTVLPTNHHRRPQIDRLLKWADLADGSGWDTLVVGNGLSINIWNDFAYSRLFERASLKPAAHQLFSDFKTQNFEIVLEALWHAERTLTALGRRTTAITALYEHVQSALFQAVLRVHVP